MLEQGAPAASEAAEEEVENDTVEVEEASLAEAEEVDPGDTAFLLTTRMDTDPMLDGAAEVADAMATMAGDEDTITTITRTATTTTDPLLPRAALGSADRPLLLLPITDTDLLTTATLVVLLLSPLRSADQEVLLLRDRLCLLTIPVVDTADTKGGTEDLDTKADTDPDLGRTAEEIGRASCRERV